MLLVRASVRLTCALLLVTVPVEAAETLVTRYLAAASVAACAGGNSRLTAAERDIGIAGGVRIQAGALPNPEASFELIGSAHARRGWDRRRTTDRRKFGHDQRLDEKNAKPIGTRDYTAAVPIAGGGGPETVTLAPQGGNSLKGDAKNLIAAGQAKFKQ